MIKLDDIHRNVVSVIDSKQGLANIQYWHTDVTKAINRAIAEVREAYTKAGLGHYFALTQRFYTTVEDLEYPYLRYVKLDRPPIQVTPTHLAFLSSNVFVTENELLDTEQDFYIGDIAYRDDGFLYVAVADTENENTYQATFSPERTRSWYPNNKLKYRAGQLIKAYSDGYYRCLVDHTNYFADPPVGPEDVLLDTVPAFERLYWMKKGSPFVTATYYDFRRLNQMKSVSNPTNFYAFSVVRDKLYVTRNVENFTLSYVPEWQYVSNLDATLDIPYELVSEIENMALRLLEPIVGANLIDNRTNINQQ